MAHAGRVLRFKGLKSSVLSLEGGLDEGFRLGAPILVAGAARILGRPFMFSVS